MKVDISQIAKVEGASLDISFCEEMNDLKQVAEGFCFTTPVSFEGRIVNTGGVLKLEGNLGLGYVSKCGRCLKDIPEHMELDIREDFVQSDKTAEDAYTYTGNHVFIDKALKDNVILNLPVRRICSDDCKGLCNICGTDLNIVSCDCTQETINPQMEALKKFFN
ncbi:MAG: DUF177 domain-containing protein [Clostridia bacterium]|nr:DUF177 domain-containing protein [Clostridia bacterium]